MYCIEKFSLVQVIIVTLVKLDWYTFLFCPGSSLYSLCIYWAFLAVMSADNILVRIDFTHDFVISS